MDFGELITGTFLAILAYLILSHAGDFKNIVTTLGGQYVKIVTVLQGRPGS